MELVTIAREPAGSADALACVGAYFHELGERFPGGFEPSGCGVVDTADLDPPNGRFLLVWAGGRALGCGGVRTLVNGVGEIKRMWVHPDLRGRGVGRQLLATLEQASRELGHRVVRLDTNGRLEEAISLYTTAGYVPINRYNDNADADHWFEKALVDP